MFSILVIPLDEISNLLLYNTVRLGLQVRSLTDIVSAFIAVILPLAGLILLAIIILGGFTILTGASNPDQVEKGKKILTQGIVGFLIVFVAYWLAQILEVLTGFPIVSR